MINSRNNSQNRHILIGFICTNSDWKLKLKQSFFSKLLCQIHYRQDQNFVPGLATDQKKALKESYFKQDQNVEALPWRVRIKDETGLSSKML